MRRWFKQTCSCRGSILTSSVACEVQVCEQRLLPAGTVTASLSASGNVTVTGDHQDNSIEVLITAEGATVIPLDGTRLRANGVTLPPGEPVEFFGEPFLPRDLTVDMKGGNDMLMIRIGQDFSFPEVEVGRNVSFNMGNGNDQLVILLTNGTLTVGGSARFDLGSGNDALVIVAPEPDEFVSPFIEVRNDFRVIGGAGQDDITLNGIDARRSLTIDTGTGDDILGASLSTVGTNWNVSLGSGNDTMFAIDIAVAGITTIDAGLGNDRCFLEDVNFGRNSSVKLLGGNDELALGEVTLAPNVILRLDGGSGADVLEGDSSQNPGVRVSGFEIRDPFGTDLGDAILQDVFAAIAEVLDPLVV